MLTESYKNRIQELAGVIEEKQEFSFDWNYLKKFIENVKNGKVNTTELSNSLYDGITKNNYNFNFDTRTQLSNPTLYKSYKDVTSKADVNNGAWAQWNVFTPTNQENPIDSYKYYITIDKSDEQNIIKVVNNINSLVSTLKPVAEKYNMKLSFKIPSVADAILKGNDNVVIHFKNKEAMNDVKSAADSWTKTNNIGTGERTHSFGVDQEGKSFTQILSKKIADQITSYVQSNISKYSVDQIFTVLKDWIPKQLKNPVAA